MKGARASRSLASPRWIYVAAVGWLVTGCQSGHGRNGAGGTTGAVRDGGASGGSDAATAPEAGTGGSTSTGDGGKGSPLGGTGAAAP